MKEKPYSVEELSLLTGVSTSGIKKAILEKRLKATKVGRTWAIDPDSDLVKKWLKEAESSQQPSEKDFKREIEKLKRDNELLGRRVRQAEMAQRRAEKEVKQLEAELAEAYRQGQERAHDNARKIYELSHEVIEQAAQENTRTLLKVVSMLANQQEPRQVLAGEVVPPESLPEA